MKNRVVVISDLHLGASPPMLSQTPRLTAFIDSLKVDGNEHLYLVVAGDFIDFLSIEHEGSFSSYTNDPKVIVGRLETAFHRDLEVYQALGRFLQRPACSLIVLVGNHDVEMALPSAQARFSAEIGSDGPRRPIFIDDGRAWSCGRLLIEHGNRYDFANGNDWDGIRQARSAHSRGENPPIGLEVSAGSEFVAKALSPLKRAYPFLDLLQPPGVLVGYLLVALEPSLLTQIPSLWLALRANFQAARNRDGNRPPKAKNIEAGSGASRDLYGSPKTFEPLAKALKAPVPEFIGPYMRWERLKFFVNAPQSDGIAELIRVGKSIPKNQLRQLRAVLDHLLRDDELKGGDDFTPYQKAAARMTGPGMPFETVIMGHTHYPTKVPGTAGSRPYYLNSGTWIDSISLKTQTLQSDAELEDWLRRLVSGDSALRTRRLTYVNATVAENGAVTDAGLNEWI